MIILPNIFKYGVVSNPLLFKLYISIILFFAIIKFKILFDKNLQLNECDIDVER